MAFIQRITINKNDNDMIEMVYYLTMKIDDEYEYE